MKGHSLSLGKYLKLGEKIICPAILYASSWAWVAKGGDQSLIKFSFHSSWYDHLISPFQGLLGLISDLYDQCLAIPVDQGFHFESICK